MGTATSRRSSCDTLSETRQFPANESPSSSSSWGVEYSEALSTWKYTSVLWGFDPRVDYTSNVKTRLQPWCVGGRHFNVRYQLPSDTNHAAIDWPRHITVTLTDGCFKLDTQIRLPVDYVQELHTEPEPSGHYLKPIQVIGYRGGIAVLQLNATDSTMQFIVVHMRSGTVLGRYTEATRNGRHYMYDCLISPDLSRFLLKPNAMYVLNFCRNDHDDILKIVSSEQRHCPIIKRLFAGSAVRQVIAFDPLYRHRRFAIGNYIKDGRDIVCIYDTGADQVVMESNSTHNQTTQQLTFSPDGLYLASLVLGRSLKDGLFNFPAVLVYSSADLTVLRSLLTHCLAEVPTLSPSALFPLFSDAGSHLAIPFGEQGTFYQQVAGVNVYRVPIHIDLRSLCRLAIRKYFDSQDVEHMVLPKQLKAYLRFQPCFN